MYTSSTFCIIKHIEIIEVFVGTSSALDIFRRHYENTLESYWSYNSYSVGWKMTRKETNLEILRQLAHYVKMNPDQRFGQILRNTGVINDTWNPQTQSVDWNNHFNEEPQETLKRIKQTKKEGI